MKRLPLLLCILLTGLLTPVYGKLDGTYMNEAGMILKTPHAAWDDKGELPHKNILFIMQQTASREVIELVQRFPGFEYEVVLTASDKSIRFRSRGFKTEYYSYLSSMAFIAIVKELFSTSILRNSFVAFLQ